jgi:hypothetical protein
LQKKKYRLSHLTRVLKGEVKLTDKMAAKIKVGMMDLHKIFENYIKNNPENLSGFLYVEKK